jgi:cobalt/nickel transport system permease protein
VAPGSVHEGGKDRIHLVYGLLVALVCLSPLGLLAPGSAWGEWSPREIKDVVVGGHALGFVPSGLARGFHLRALCSDYAVPGLPDWLGYGLSAVAGGAILIIVFKLIGVLRRQGAVKTYQEPG